MVEAFRSILSDPQCGFHLSSVVLDAIRKGPKVPGLRDAMIAILTDGNSPDTEKIRALDALLHAIPDGVHDVVRVYRDYSRCWQERTPYDASIYLQALRHRGASLIQNLAKAS
jgi:hypothetical protein